MNKQLFQQLKGYNKAIPEQARKMADLLKKAKNPYEVIADAINSNPKARMWIDMVKNGANPENLFYTKAQEENADPEDILNLLK